ncbi:uncharacterized protein isoform X1 [Salmo salar]|uniref:Uncharacterized protein isoform X1 n=1 Tax=Salmo salar TaxID=8030 RepID=A0A1S3QD00_SALSA|nr:uncharacterized protein LOC106591183 isoform X1 [Salmo salar]|eukprot:XP_014037868.1 PREDICTED: small EDRK-rich factor 2 isoform X1 [Salmo salar]
MTQPLAVVLLSCASPAFCSQLIVVLRHNACVLLLTMRPATLLVVQMETQSTQLVPLFPIGGNQRELARAKNAKKQADQTKGKKSEDGLSAAARKLRDAEIMQQKQRRAADKEGHDPKSK